MYSLTKNSTLRDLAIVEAPGFAISLIIGQVFLTRIGNFTLELLAFAALWFSMSGAIKLIDDKLKSKRENA